ncbi:RING-type E3 ubiquitin transferase [Salvia divinorum]|uniref:RING-type E3 ubiquitin transferase n=1 Tax=Salvia divinorum TaxID=28513 RepID=A0ABD1G209_SALDI
MSMHDRATAAVLAQMMFAADGVLFGAGVAYVAYRSIRKYAAAASALRKIRGAPSVLPSDLRSILTDGDDSSSSDPESSSSNGGGRLVVVRGSMEVKSAAEKANWKALMGNGLVASKASGEKGVILQRTQTCIYNEWKGVFGWTADLRSTIAGSLKEQETSPTRMVACYIFNDHKI